MFSSQLYDSSVLSDLYGRIDRPRLHRHAPLPTTQRALLISTLHMLQGLPSPLYPKTGVRFTLTDQPLELTHLAEESISRCLTDFAETGSKLQFVREQGRRVYGMPNALLKAFAESTLRIVEGIERGFTQQLRVVQQEGGRLDRSQQEYQHSAQTPVTLLSLLQSTRALSPLLTFLVSAFSRLALRDAPSPSDLQTAVLFLLNLYHEQCGREYLLQEQLGVYLHRLFGGLLRGYLEVMQEWFEMDERALAMKTHLGFFVKLDQILTLEEEKIFDVQSITRKQAVPELFRSTFERVVELGKTVQFIKLYFGPEQRENYRQFMAVSQQFAPLYAFLRSLQGEDARNRFFAPKPRKYQTVSSKLAGIVRPFVTARKVEQDNPFQIYPEVTGILNLRSDYRYLHKPGKTEEKKEVVLASDQGESDYSGLDINRQFEARFSQILQSITQKCLAILQQDRIRSSIERTLLGIKRIMLFQQGDFIQQFLELTRELFEKPSEKISRNNIERLIEEAVRSSSAQGLPEAIRENISFTFLRNSQGVKAWRIFSLVYRPEKPTHCVFTPKVMADYNCLSNMLFNLRHCEEVLSEAWGRMAEGMGGVLKARNAVHHYVKALQGFIFAELEALWVELLEAIAKTGNVLTILELNSRALARIRATTFENAPLCNCLLSLVKIVDRFENIQHRLQNGEEDGLRSDVDQIWSWFMAMLDQSRLIPHFCDTFDFRGEYSL